MAAAILLLLIAGEIVTVFGGFWLMTQTDIWWLRCLILLASISACIYVTHRILRFFER